MNQNNNPQEELEQIKGMFQSLKYFKELLSTDKHKIIIADHVEAIKVKIAVTENRLLDFVPEDLLNELGF